MDQPSLFAQSPPAADQRLVAFNPDFAGWQAAARSQLAAGRRPESLWWTPDPTAATPANPDQPIPVPRRFMELARPASCHRASDRWALLYAVLWRLTHGERHLLQLAGDPQTARLHTYAKAVRRDVHKMKAFVRFREVAEPGHDEPRYVAWFEPDHHIVGYASGFFRRRFANMRWSILTPDRCAHWDGHGEVWFTPGTIRSAAPDADEMETAWQTYYRHIFNPARVKLAAMRAEMPQKYWKNLPEARLIPELVRQADRQVATMTDAPRAEQAPRCGPRPPTPDAARHRAIEAAPADSLARLSLQAAGCRDCALAGPATRTVFGEGPSDARLMIVGEQPGDREDLAGRPFVGPAGQLLDRVLAEAGIDRSGTYVTNAVKHFKYRPVGKTRLHARPDAAEIRACWPWLDAEIRLVDPEFIVCLGATATGALLGGKAGVHQNRGRWLTRAGRQILVTVHPAWLLRLPDSHAAGERAAFAADLSRVANALAA
ncbi:UdgX family uracil-DNA binding protein [Salinisphaera sp. P385]|uniref:Type-4 uracil-DNA glycosylase n=1 Tax=Spectribacter acetivorans TaxID=3075603 RepID=A0ABU3B6Y2_9GAMM|nr:UdgX family uracil-DNA binding protein [Salinisphaera sp. P385]MDT0618199.1 UdgX family uracil-DNA binding protein [Salinisphaera sp. P385]